ncbi:hypothetical protein T310_4748 [Rasamsonia emersonii CBS 393.64]|uniref:Uncharacterized protein n=1 Tax=Rasamsonia emersonii (strain ATCC 16479 / CBS 393.64 / IMI 116815) TaxID=1408163 RepID=A0A0F4YSJ1_RASE3|nr:hypothetical protein T310_4748 [Rasamsonia emersonii CBS 393.64]KKA21242.1 hypothetical protein T310_4748 [Rasamsonia emersonii CBS 393.64]
MPPAHHAMPPSRRGGGPSRIHAHPASGYLQLGLSRRSLSSRKPHRPHDPHVSDSIGSSAQRSISANHQDRSQWVILNPPSCACSGFLAMIAIWAKASDVAQFPWLRVLQPVPPVGASTSACYTADVGELAWTRRKSYWTSERLGQSKIHQGGGQSLALLQVRSCMQHGGKPSPKPEELCGCQMDIKDPPDSRRLRSEESSLS